MSDPARDRRVARDAAVQSLVANAVYLAIMLGLTVAIAKRDSLTRAAMRARARLRPTDPHAAQLADFRREVSDYSRGGATGPTARVAPRKGGLYECP